MSFEQGTLQNERPFSLVYYSGAVQVFLVNQHIQEKDILDYVPYNKPRTTAEADETKKQLRPQLEPFKHI